MINFLITVVIGAVEKSIMEYLKESLEDESKPNVEIDAVVARLLEIMIKKRIISKNDFSYIVEGYYSEMQLFNSEDYGRT